MKYIRITSLLITLLLINTVSCGNSGLSDNTAGSTLSVSTDFKTAVLDNDPHIEAVDCGGDTFTVLSRKVGSNYCYPYWEFFAEGETGDTVNDAVYQRNRYIEEKYNLKLQLSVEDNVDGATQKSVLAGDNEYDLVIPMHTGAFSLVVQGIVQDIANIPYVDISKSYWMNSIMESTSINGKNYFLTGDLNLASLNGVGAIYFNKELAAEKGIDDLYDTVKSGNWTIDKFSEYCRDVTRDLNGDTVMNGDDMFGLTCNGFVWQPLYAGTAGRLIGKDSSDTPYFNWGSEKNIEIITKIVNFLNNHESVILVNQFPELQEAGGWGPASIQMFSENRALFWIEIIYGILQLRDMNTDFGILPMPKYDLSQESYASYVHPNWTSTCCVPITNTKSDLTGRILEDMAYQSSLTVRPAYYDVTLKGKISRDDESGEMLDIIYSNINLDLALIMSGLPIDTAMRSIVIDNNTAFASTIASYKSACEETIRKNTDAIAALK